jgi:hypothetical protein
LRCGFAALLPASLLKIGNRRLEAAAMGRTPSFQAVE